MPLVIQVKYNECLRSELWSEPLKCCSRVESQGGHRCEIRCEMPIRCAHTLHTMIYTIHSTNLPIVWYLACGTRYNLPNSIYIFICIWHILTCICTMSVDTYMYADMGCLFMQIYTHIILVRPAPQQQGPVAVRLIAVCEAIQQSCLA